MVGLRDLALATSGDYRQYFEQDGRRFSHTIDARTGEPIAHNLASVSVLHPKAAYADAYATAINVLGPEAGWEFAEQHRLPVCMIIREKTGFVTKMSPDFERLVVHDAASERSSQ